MKSRALLLLFILIFLLTPFADIYAQGIPLVDVWDSTDPDNYILIGQIHTIRTAQSGRAHYDYWSASAHPYGVNVDRYHSNLWVHENTNNGDLTFGFVFGKDNSGSPWIQSYVNFRIVDSVNDPYVSQSDDPGEAVEKPAGSNAYEGSFYYADNTDGIAVSRISGGTWTIIIDAVDFGKLINEWYASNGEIPGSFSDDIPLTLGNEYRLTPAGNPPSGKPVVFSLYADAGDDSEICAGQNVILGGNPTADDGAEPYSYLWTPSTGLDNPSAANPVAAPTETTTYSVTVTDTLGNTADDEVTITVFNLKAHAGQGASVYSGESILLGGDPTAFDGKGNYSYSWTPDDYLSDPTSSNPVFMTFLPGEYELTVSVTDDCNTVEDNVVIVVEAFPLFVDIKPGSDENPLNLKEKGVTPVAVYSTEVFDATSIDVSSIIFGPAEAVESHGKGHYEDVNEDGITDLMLHFDTQAIGASSEDTELCLTGVTTSGAYVSGCDFITIKGNGKLKKDEIEEAEESLIAEYTLAQNYPNPFNPSTYIRFNLKEAGFVKLDIYNTIGQVVATLVKENRAVGEYTEVFLAENLNSGIYFYRLEAPGIFQVKKMLLVK